MTEPLEILAAPIDSHASSKARRRAVICLIIACIAWGGSFTWAKALMTGINLRAGADLSATLGVLVLLSWRFLLAGIVWMLLFPAARSGWNLPSVGRATALGTVHTIAMIAQQMGLIRSS